MRWFTLMLVLLVAACNDEETTAVVMPAESEEAFVEEDTPVSESQVEMVEVVEISSDVHPVVVVNSNVDGLDAFPNCMVRYDTLSQAREEFANFCPNSAIRDCEREGDMWVCANYRITSDSSYLNLATDEWNDPTGVEGQINGPVNDDNQDIVIVGDDDTPVPDDTPVANLSVEIEETVVGEGWEIETDLAGFNGSGYVTWRGYEQGRTGNGDFPAGANGQTTVTFNITEPGDYRLQVRGAQIDPERWDYANDYWLYFNREWRKTSIGFGSDRSNTWVSGGNMQSPSEAPIFTFTEGSNSIRIAGRSTAFAIDRVFATPVNTTTPVAATDPVDVQSRDAIWLHHDFGGDPDDFTAIVANRSVADELQLDIAGVVSGTVGDGRNWKQAGKDLADSLFNNSYAADDTNSVGQVAAQWRATITNGGRVYVAEAGTSDFTADVLRELSDLDRSKITVVQHSTASNEAQTASNDLALVKSVTDYVLVDNGNVGGNNSAGLMSTNDSVRNEFQEAALQTQYSSQWQVAFDQQAASPNLADRIDFSDTVELLYIVGDDTTKTISQFQSTYIN